MDCKALLLGQELNSLDLESGFDNVLDKSMVDPEIIESNELHPIEIYENMIKEKPTQTLPLYDPKFELKKLRKIFLDKIFDFGCTFGLDPLTCHLALKYLEVIFHYINFYRKNNKAQKLPSDPKPVKEVVPKTSYLFGKDVSPRIKALSQEKRELITISCLLIAAKFNERDEEMLKISHLQKEAKKDYSYRSIVACESILLQELNWSMMLQTPFHYLKLFTSCGICFQSDQYTLNLTKISFQSYPGEDQEAIDQCIVELNEKSDYFINLSIHDYFMLQFDEEIIAMAAVVCARKITKITPEYSENFEKLYKISYEDLKSAFERLWTFHMQCSAETPEKMKEDIYNKKLSSEKKQKNLRKNSGVESKKSVALMPPKIKSNKITFSDLETPKEASKNLQIPTKTKQPSCFSDLYPIAEEKTQIKTPSNPTTQTQISVQSLQNTSIAPKPNRSLRKSKINISLTSPDPSKFLSDQKLPPKAPSKSDLDHKFISLTLESKNDFKNDLKSEERGPCGGTREYNRIEKTKGKEKSMRRNRKERMKSAHSQNRPGSNKDIKNISKVFCMKDVSKVIPKICGAGQESLEGKKDEGKDKIKQMLRKIDSVEDCSISMNQTETNEGFKFLNTRKYQVVKASNYPNYGPLLTNKMPSSSKNSFIETQCVKLQLGHPSEPNPGSKNGQNTKKESEHLSHIVSQDSFNSNYFQKSGLSGRNTTVSDKNSDQDKKRQISQNESKNYYSSKISPQKNYQKQTNKNELLKRGRSADMRRGRASRNKDRMKQQTSKGHNGEPCINKVNHNHPSKQRMNNKFNHPPPSHKSLNKRFQTKKQKNRLLKPQNSKYKKQGDHSVDVDIQALEGNCSKTFIKSSYKISGLLQTSDKGKKEPKNCLQKDNLGSIRTRLDFSRRSVTKENNNKENTSDEQAKINYFKRKKQYEKGSKGGTGCKAGSNLTHRKAISHFQN